MARRKKPNFHPPVPTMRPHRSGQARVELNGRTHYLGPWGSVQAAERYADLIRRWEAGGRQPLAKPQTVVKAQRARAAAAVAERTVAAALGDYLAHLAASGRYMKQGLPTSERAIVAKAIAEFVEVAGNKRAKVQLSPDAS